MHHRDHPEDESPILLPDGGEEAEEDEEDEAEEEPTEEESEEAEGNDESTDEQPDDEPEREYEDEEGTNVLHLDLEGLFVNLLGLEVDLEEVVLDLRAVPGEGKLVGNLLGQVAGLLDDGLLSGLGGLLGGEDGGLLTSLPGKIVSWVKEQLNSLAESIPVEEVLTNVINELLQELFDSTDGEGE